MLTLAVRAILLRGPPCVWGLWPAKVEHCGGGRGGSWLPLLTTPPCCTQDMLLFKRKQRKKT